MAIYFFDKNQTLIKIVPESATFEAIQTQELDDDSLLKDTLSVTIKGDERLISAEYMAVKSYRGNAQTFDMYRIVTDTTPDKSMSFTGMSLAPYELNGHILKDLRPANHSLSYTLNRVLDGTDWHVGYIEDGLSNVTTTFYYVSAKEALKELQSLVGCEFVFKVEISGQKITDKWIEVYSEMGNRTKKRFNYGTNALTVVRETNKADIYTALIGRGKGEEVSSAEDNTGGQAGYGRKITFEDIEWSTANGNPLNKPIGQYYLELPQATQAYGIKNIDGTMKARVGIVDFDDEEDKNKLINLTYQQLLVSSRPKVLFKTTVANIGATGIGDTVTIHRHDLNIHYQTRVRKIVRNKLNDNKTQIELGDAVVTASTKQAKKNNATIKNLNQELERVKTNVTTSQNSADGKNTIFYGSAEPERQRTGDTWYRPHPSIAGETQMLVWNGTAWELVIDTSDLTSVSREVIDAINLAEEAKSLAISEADSALAQAKADATAKANAIQEQVSGEVNIAISTAEDAKALAISEAEQALTNAKAHADAEVLASKEHFDGLIATTQSDVSNAQATADSAVEQIDTAVANAGFTSLDETIQNMNDIAGGVKSELDLAVQNAGFTSLDEVVSDTRYLGSSANANAQTAINEAQTAQVNSLTALGKADNALDGVSNLDIRVDDVESELELKADNTFMTEDGTLTTLSNAITFNANRFSSDMSRIESRVESLASEINLVILRDAFEDRTLFGNEVYPNATSSFNKMTMREMINVKEGEQLALSKETIDGGSDVNMWRISFYNDNTYISRTSTADNQSVITVPSGATKMWVSYPPESKPQIVRGMEFPPYRPNIADQMTSNEMVLFRNQYDEYADRTERRLSAIDSEGGRLETAETLITQTAGGLQTTVGKVDSQETRISTVEQTANGLQTTVADKANQSQVTQLANGLNALVQSKPKNVINNGDFSNGYAWWSFGTNIIPKRIIENRLELDLTTDSSATVGTLNRFWSYAQLQRGKKYRVTFDAYTFLNGRVLSVGQAGSNNIEKVVLSNEVRSYEVIYEATINASLSIYLHEAGTYQIGNIVVVETSAISQSQISVLSGSIKQSVSDIDGRVSTQEQTLNTISSTVSGHDGRISTVEQTASGLQSAVYNADGSSKITQLATGISSVVTSVNNLSAGGRNLLLGTKDFSGPWISLEDWVYERTYNGVEVYSRSEAWRGMTRRHYLDVGTYTFSAYVLSDTAKNVRVSTIASSDADSATVNSPNYKDYPVSNRWQRVRHTFEVTKAGYVRLRIENTTNNGKTTLGGFKLEEGNIASDWTPAPEDTQSQITQLANNINLRVSKGDVINQINISTEGILIDGSKTHITGTTTIDDGVIKNAHIANLNASKINAGTIDSARIDAEYIVTNGLSANVVESTHIKSSAALIDKIFANEALITRLTSNTIFASKIKAIEIDASKITSGTIATAILDATAIVTAGLSANVVEATHIKAEAGLVGKLFSTTAYIEELTNKTVFTEKIQAINISADKVTTGTLDAGKVKVINLDAENITANQAKLIQAGFESSSGGTLALSGDQILSTASDNSQVYLQNGIVGMRNPSGASIGQIGYRYAGGSPQMNLFTTEGSHFSLVQRIAGNDVQTIYITNGGKEYHNSAVNSWFNSLTNTFSGEIKIMNTKNLSMSGGNIVNPYQINLQYGGKIWSTSSNSDLNISSSARLFAHSNGSVAFEIDSGYMYLRRNLSMEGNKITNQSDRRLKTNIIDTPVDSLFAISNWDFKAFDRVNNGSHDDIGLIAQDTSEIVVYDEENDTYYIDSSKQIMMNSHGIQQLDIKVDDEITQLKAQIASLQDELALLKGA